MIRFLQPTSALAFCVFLAFCAAPTFAQDKAYVLFSDSLLAGDSTDPDHLGWIEARSVTGGLVIPPAVGPAQPQPELDPIVFTKPLDRSSHALNYRLAQGDPDSLVKIDLCNEPAGPGSQQCNFQLELTNTVIETVDLGGSTCIEAANCTSAATEKVVLRFTGILWRFKSDGMAPVEVIWNPFEEATP